ncbi:MAG: ATP-binding cassette domain-containing protein [bacterium]|nr:ATP-binding cassette domain-containing protein [bacterium]
MIQLTRLAVRFPDKVLFEDLSWRILPGQRIGLVGDNGVGKTTLMRILAGEREADEGQLHLAPRMRVGYLSQTFSFSSDLPLLELVLEAAGDVRQVEREIAETRLALAGLGDDDEDQPALLAHLGHLQERFEHADGWRLDSEARRILQGLGFTPLDAERPLSQFSGGWQMRAAMARLLLAAPDLLLLDEPTNHLDTDALEWLERFLRSYDGTVITISHDRFFLDRTVTQVAEIARGRLTLYQGNYSRYRELKEEQQARRAAEAERMKGRIEEMQHFIERFRYKSTKARQVQSRVKQLEKLALPEVEREERGVHFRFPACERSGDVVLELRGLAMDYGQGPVFRDLDLLLKRGERVALTGPNGAGKSTLARIISGLQQPSAGQVRLGHKVQLDVYTQEVEDQMDSRRTVLEELASHNQGLGQTELRSLLGAFLFGGDSVFKRVEVLSGGEKSRLAVAGILLDKCNFLVLDEPTNHLDLKAKDMLQQALSSFAGTVLVVSHDRYFLDRVVTRVLELRQGRLLDRPGSYSEFVAWRDELERQEAGETARRAGARATQAASEGSPAARPRGREERKAATEEKIRRGRLLREAAGRAEELEAEIARREARLLELEQALAREEIWNDSEKMKQASTEYARVREIVKGLYPRWEKALAELEEVRAVLEAEQVARPGVDQSRGMA